LGSFSDGKVFSEIPGGAARYIQSKTGAGTMSITIPEWVLMQFD